jgi:hypothetical protein
MMPLGTAVCGDAAPCGGKHFSPLQKAASSEFPQNEFRHIRPIGPLPEHLKPRPDADAVG